MTYKNLTADKEHWIETQVTPAPEVFILAYAGTSFKEWKIVNMLSYEDFLKRDAEEWDKIAWKKFPSAMLIKIYIARKE